MELPLRGRVNYNTLGGRVAESLLLHGDRPRPEIQNSNDLLDFVGDRNVGVQKSATATGRTV